ncbi:MAG: hypothetical protein C4293_03715 [Nitrospiraceae bacterium]
MRRCGDAEISPLIEGIESPGHEFIDSPILLLSSFRNEPTPLSPRPGILVADTGMLEAGEPSCWEVE